MPFIRNRGNIDFNAGDTGDSTTQWRMMTASSDGTELWRGALTATATLGNNQFFRIASEALVIEIPTGTGVDNEAAKRALEGLVFDGTNREVYIEMLDSAGAAISPNRVSVSYVDDFGDGTGTDWEYSATAFA